MHRLDGRRAFRRILLLAMLAGCSARAAGPRTAEVAVLDAEHAALRTAFERDAGRPRLLLLLSPT
jgi:hypothetical protein